MFRAKCPWVEKGERPTNDFFSPNINQGLQQYDNLKCELQSLYKDEGKHTMFRAKCRWVEKGERPTKYFFNLEKIKLEQKDHW